MSTTDRISIETGSTAPLVSVIVIDSRSKTNKDWVDICLQSVRIQWFKDWELIVIDNTDKKLSIGAAYNEAVKYATTDWVYFLGDDDYIQPDFLGSLYRFAIESDKMVPKLAGATSYGFVFNEKTEQMGLLKKVPFGMAKREKILEYKLDEALTKHIDVDFWNRLEISKGKHNVAIMYWNYGYFYRSHDKQVSGRKGY